MAICYSSNRKLIHHLVASLSHPSCSPRPLRCLVVILSCQLFFSSFQLSAGRQLKTFKSMTCLITLFSTLLVLYCWSVGFTESFLGQQSFHQVKLGEKWKCGLLCSLYHLLSCNCSGASHIALAAFTLSIALRTSYCPQLLLQVLVQAGHHPQDTLLALLRHSCSQSRLCHLEPPLMYLASKNLSLSNSNVFSHTDCFR